jgi:NAD(P)-dependent dehydrogenase (short-subunit alcohol dehydrogenase family)
MSEKISLHGKSALVTGATSGIGLVTARELARMGARVTIIGRSQEKLAAAVRDILAETGQEVETIQSDLSVKTGVREAAAAFLSRNRSLHILVNNAGAYFARREVTADGYEKTFALNHLAYFHLTLLLEPVLRRSAPARIVNVSSGAHLGGRIDFNDLHNLRRYAGFGAYSQSKLANIYFTYEHSRRLEGSGVSANCLHPGFVATNFGKSNGGFFKPVFALLQMMALTPEKGAQTSIYLASSPDVEGVTGKYYQNCREIPSSALSYQREAARKLWQVSLEMCDFPPQ